MCCASSPDMETTYHPERSVHGKQDIAGIVMKTGKAEIINDVCSTLGDHGEQ